MSWLNQSIIYQIFAGRWESANYQDHPGQVFHQLEGHDFSQLTQAGINCFYLMGALDNRGPIVVGVEVDQPISNNENRLPSPFAITDHRNPNPDLGSLEDLKSLINRLHHQDIKLLLDFVPEHTSLAHPWVKDNPDYYYEGDAEQAKKQNSDVIPLNYSNPKLRQEMITTLLTIGSWETDGVRCDLAHLVPLDFWQQAIKQVKDKYPDFVFIAEVYPDSIMDLTKLHQHLDAGFDAVYHEPLYRNIKLVTNQNKPLEYITKHLQHTLGSFDTKKLINYLANHDDPEPISSPKYYEALFALAIFFPGIPFIYNGSLNHFPHRLAHHYLDVLPQSYLETKSLPSHFNNLLQLRLQYQPKITGLKIETNGLITCDLKTNQKPAILVLNLTNLPQDLDLYKLKSTGLIHHSTTEEFLSIGQAELFFTS